jgi:hypothetical protein
VTNQRSRPATPSRARYASTREPVQLRHSNCWPRLLDPDEPSLIKKVELDALGEWPEALEPARAACTVYAEHHGPRFPSVRWGLEVRAFGSDHRLRCRTGALFGRGDRCVSLTESGQARPRVLQTPVAPGPLTTAPRVQVGCRQTGPAPSLSAIK